MSLSWHDRLSPVPESPAEAPSRCLFLFTKPARPGRVKTRLTRGEGALSPERAALLHAAFLGDLAERLLPGTVARSEVRFRLRLAWALEAGAALPDLAAEVAPMGEVAIPDDAALDAVRQAGGDLGEKLFEALSRAAAEHPGGVAAVGSDHPTLPLERVRRAFALLDGGADVVLGPADDGGYYLVALRPGAVRRRLFAEIPWSTGGVLAATEARCRELALRLVHLPPGQDVDEPADLDRLAALLAGDRASRLPGEASDCPRTRRLLRAWGRLPALTLSTTTTTTEEDRA